MIYSDPVYDPYISALRLITTSDLSTRLARVWFFAIAERSDATGERGVAIPRGERETRALPFAYRDPSTSHLRSSIIVNPNKRERARAKLRVGHKTAWQRKRGMALVARPVVLISDSGLPPRRPVSFYDVTRGPLFPSSSQLVRWVRGHRGSGQDSS